MKALFFFIVGALVGGFVAKSYYEDRVAAPSVGAAARDAGDKMRDVASDTRDAIGRKLADWHLTGDDIKADLAKTGQVVRTQARTAGNKISDARILAVIKSKYVLDSQLSALDINADVSDGAVTLNGTVASHALIGRAVATALETDGVHSVTSKLTVKP